MFVIKLCPFSEESSERFLLLFLQEEHPLNTSERPCYTHYSANRMSRIGFRSSDHTQQRAAIKCSQQCYWSISLQSRPLRFWFDFVSALPEGWTPTFRIQSPLATDLINFIFMSEPVEDLYLEPYQPDSIVGHLPLEEAQIIWYQSNLIFFLPLKPVIHI